MSERWEVISISPDGPALLAQRLVRRLQRDKLLPDGHGVKTRTHADAVTEALADEIHQAAVDGTMRSGS